MGKLILPPGYRDTKPAPEAPKDLTRETAVLAINDDCKKTLALLPPSDETMAYTRTLISRGVYAILTMAMPPSMHPEYELVTLFERTDKGAPWIMRERWIRGPGETAPLARLSGAFQVVPMEDQ